MLLQDISCPWSVSSVLTTNRQWRIFKEGNTPPLTRENMGSGVKGQGGQVGGRSVITKRKVHPPSAFRSACANKAILNQTECKSKCESCLIKIPLVGRWGFLWPPKLVYEPPCAKARVHVCVWCLSAVQSIQCTLLRVLYRHVGLQQMCTHCTCLLAWPC